MPDLIPLKTWNKDQAEPQFYSYVPNGLSCPHCDKELMDTDGIVRYRVPNKSLWVQVSCVNNTCGFVSYRTVKVNNGE